MKDNLVELKGKLEKIEQSFIGELLDIKKDLSDLREKLNNLEKEVFNRF